MDALWGHPERGMTWPQSTSSSQQHIAVTLCESGLCPVLVYQLGTGNLRSHTRFVT